MLRASALALLLLTAPVYAQEAPDFDDMLIEIMNADGDDAVVLPDDSGTPNVTVPGDPTVIDDPDDEVVEGDLDGDGWEDPPTGYAVLYLPDVPIDPTNIYDPRSPAYIPPSENPDFVPDTPTD